MSTEAKLWQTLQRVDQRDLGLALHRIEASTLLGVSDLEYVGQHAHGWVELKVGHSASATSKIVLHQELTPQQYLWLQGHHQPGINLHSLLLIGFCAKARLCWDRFLLLPPRLAAHFLKFPVSEAYILAHGGARYSHPRRMLEAISQGRIA